MVSAVVEDLRRAGARLWSPYYEIDVSEMPESGRLTGYNVAGDKDGHQRLDLSDRPEQSAYIASPTAPL